MNKTQELLLPPPSYETETLYGRISQQNTFVKSLREQKLHHAFLLHGPESIGKATLAWHMARFAMIHPDGGKHTQSNLLTFNSQHPLVRQTATGVYQDMVFLTAKKGASLITIEEVRTMKHLFFEKSAHGSYRVCLVDSIDDLNQSAANALLKILEEPPHKSLFLLISHRPEGLLKTIISRCMKIPLMPLDVENGEKVINSCLEKSSKEARKNAFPEGKKHTLTMLKKGNLQRAFFAATSQMFSYEQSLETLLKQGNAEKILTFAKTVTREHPLLMKFFVKDFGDILVKQIKEADPIEKTGNQSFQESFYWKKLNTLFDDFITTWHQCLIINMDKYQAISSLLLRWGNLIKHHATRNHGR